MCRCHLLRIATFNWSGKTPAGAAVTSGWPRKGSWSATTGGVGPFRPQRGRLLSRRANAGPRGGGGTPGLAEVRPGRLFRRSPGRRCLKYKLLSMPIIVWGLQLLYVAVALVILAILAAIVNRNTSTQTPARIIAMVYVVIMVIIDVIWRLAIRNKF
jgi:hypothetical protein